MYETIEPQVMTARYERAHVWGIDCVERLTWRGWEPGGSYVRTVTLKNVGKKDPKRHLESKVGVLMSSNITQCLGAMLGSVVFV